MASHSRSDTRLDARCRQAGIEARCIVCDEFIPDQCYALVHNRKEGDGVLVRPNEYIVCMCADCYVQHLNVKQNLDGLSEYGIGTMTCPHCLLSVDNGSVQLRVVDLSAYRQSLWQATDLTENS
jgi:hypothetical protein